MIFTFKDKDDFEKAKICWICQKEFGESKKVRDHCHFTLENIVGRLITNVISNSKNQNLLL